MDKDLKEDVKSVLSHVFHSQDSVKNLSFIAGILWALPPNPKMILEDPLSTTFTSVIYGSMCMYGSLFISNELPQKGKTIFAGLVGASLIYHIGKYAYNVYKGNYTNEKTPFINIIYNHTSVSHR